MSYGLALGGVLLIAANFWPGGSDWDRFGVALVLALVSGFTAAPFMLLRFGRWRILADGYRDSPEFTRWSRVMNASALIGFTVLLLALVAVELEVRYLLLSRLPRARTWAAMDTLFHRTMLTIGLTFGAGLAAGLAALVISARAAVRRQRARDAEHQGAA
jgi:hypothetical protein